MRTSAHSQGPNMQTNLFSFDRNANKIKIMFLRIQMNVWKEAEHYLKFQNRQIKKRQTSKSDNSTMHLRSILLVNIT